MEKSIFTPKLLIYELEKVFHFHPEICIYSER